MSDLARRLEAPLHGRDARFGRVTTDTRSLEAGDLFVALRGDRFDGHAFLGEAVRRRASGALVSDPGGVDLPQVVVPDTLRGLQDYAQSWRGDFETPVVAVTGSNGKTTVKQMLSAIFTVRGPVLATQGNLNNHIGVPLTLLRLRAEHRSAVIEMGANHLGEIARLAEIARPDIGLVTNAGDAHLEGFGSREGVARGKGELFEGLQGHGVAVINADDAFAPLWRGLAGESDVLTFGLSEEAHVRAVDLQPEPADAPTGSRFVLLAAEGRQSVTLPLPGRHNVCNALAAAACAVAAGIDLRDVAAGLLNVEPAPGRVTWRRARGGARLLDDTYNANPTSLRAALELLRTVRGRHWLVLGDMGELGPDAERLHQEAGALARELGIERLYALGDLALAAARAFGPGSVHFRNADDLIGELRLRLTPEVALLVKGSRAARMERVVAGLATEGSGGGH